MRSRIGLTISLTMTMTAGLLAASLAAQAQDVPGIEICTVEKTMERRTSCLQSNVNFLQTSLAKLTLDQNRKLDAANRQIEALKATLASLQKTVEDLTAKKTREATPATDAAPAKDAAKEGAK